MSSERLVLVVLAGLPGTGKSTLAHLLAQALEAPLFDKDAVRAALFGPLHVTYSRAQDDLVLGVLFQAVEHVQRTALARHAILDGRTFSRRDQVEDLRAALQRLDVEPRLIECTCAPEIARARLAVARELGLHPAADRGPELYQRLAAEAHPIQLPKLVLDTSEELPETLAARALDYIRSDLPTG